MKQYITLAILTLFTLATPLHGQTIEVSGGNLPAYQITDHDPLLSGVYVVYSTLSGSITYNSSSTSAIEWYTYGAAGAADETLLNYVGSGSTLTTIESNMGYAIKQDSKFTYIWIVDFQSFPFVITSMSSGDIVEGSPCQQEIVLKGTGNNMTYYTPLSSKGVQEIEREVTLTWNTLEWNDEWQSFEDITTTVTEPFASSIWIDAPYTATPITATGDQFLQTWGLAKTVSFNYESSAIVAYTTATQVERDNDNEADETSSTGLGGSAPVIVSFEVYYDDTKHVDWQFSYEESFETIYQHYYSIDSFEYSFVAEGTVYVRAVVTDTSNSDSDLPCAEYTSSTYTITVGESKLEAPNFFTPDTTPGENDEWKVAYKSIVSYRCTIFDRWGVQLFRSTDPSKGWDGKRGGNYLPSGVYFYVIEAKGADGVEYKLNGDINILRAKQ